MSNTISTVTSKGRITIPARFRDELSLAVGQRIGWEVRKGQLVGRRIRTLAELAGSLRSNRSVVTVAGMKALAREARAERQARKQGKP